MRSPAHSFCHYPAIPVPRGLPVQQTPASPCPYLEGRTSISRGFRCEDMPGWMHQALMDAGFRRSGDVFYQMVCPRCRACVPLRVPTGSFRPSRSQRRALAKNRDLRFTVSELAVSDEKHHLYRRYLAQRHDGTMSGERDELERFLYRSPTRSVEVCYRDADDRLLAVGICDLTPAALSTVYFYFEPEQQRRSLGTYGSLMEIRIAQSLGLPFYYLGYWVGDCETMAYKSRFRPCEVLRGDGVWRHLDERQDFGDG